LVVGAFAANQYRHWTGQETEKPDNPPRHYTTFGRFYFFGFVYVAAFIGAYVLLVLMPAPVVAALKDKVKDFDYAKNLLGAVINPRFIFAVLLITTASTNIPLLVKWEKVLRKTLHDWAKTPSHVRGAIDYLLQDYQAKFKMDDLDVRMVLDSDPDLKSYLYGYCFPAKGKPRDRSDHLLNLWLEINYLEWKIRQIAPKAEYSTCLNKCKNQYALFESNFERLKPDVELYFTSKHSYEKSDKLLHKLEKEVTNKALALLREILTVACCGIFATFRSMTDRARALEAMNLDSSLVGHDPINWPVIVWSLLLIFITAFLPTTVYLLMDLPKATPAEGHLVPFNWNMAFLWSIGALLLHGAAVIIAIICSRQMSPGRKQPEKISDRALALKKTKAAFWAGIFAVIASLWILVSIAYPELQKLQKDKGAVDIIWLALHGLWPWCLVPMVSAVFTVIHREDAMAGRIKIGFRQVALRISSQAAFTCVMGILATLLFLHNKALTSIETAFLIYTAVVSFFIGGALGWMLPKGYRESLESETNEEPDGADFRHRAQALGA